VLDQQNAALRCWKHPRTADQIGKVNFPMADREFTTTSESCSNELPQTSNPANCDAIPCNAIGDNILCEEGPRCRECFAEFGGTPVTADPQFYRPESRPPMRAFDFGTAMLCALDRLEKEGIL